MKVFEGSKNYVASSEGCVVTLGVFDGVHLGHQHLLHLCRMRSREIKARSLVYTFDPHPVQVLFPEACPPLIQTREQKLKALAALEINDVIIESFTKEFSQLNPTQFFEDILLSRLKSREIIIGYDFTFGAGRKGTTHFMKEMGQAKQVPVHVLDAFLMEGHLISSSVIRKLIQLGDVDLAARMLSRPFALEGQVVRGDGMGAQLGFPTANLIPNNELLPAPGVYATRTHCPNISYSSITNVGTRPTFSGADLRVETHLFNFSGNLLNEYLEIDFLHRLRSEIKFESPADLVAQIHKDVERAAEYFKESK